MINLEYRKFIPNIRVFAKGLNNEGARTKVGFITEENKIKIVFDNTDGKSGYGIINLDDLEMVLEDIKNFQGEEDEPVQERSVTTMVNLPKIWALKENIDIGGNRYYAGQTLAEEGDFLIFATDRARYNKNLTVFDNKLYPVSKHNII